MLPRARQPLTGAPEIASVVVATVLEKAQDIRAASRAHTFGLRASSRVLGSNRAHEYPNSQGSNQHAKEPQHSTDELQRTICGFSIPGEAAACLLQSNALSPLTL